jgi:hypothetical protein
MHTYFVTSLLGSAKDRSMWTNPWTSLPPRSKKMMRLWSERDWSLEVTRMGALFDGLLRSMSSALEAQLSVADHRETMRAAGAFTETASAVTVIARLQDDGDELALISQAHGPFHVTLLTRAAPQSVSTSTLLAISDAQSALLKPHAP